MKKQNGFTLIEILIAAFIFTVVVGAVTVIFASNNNIKSQTKVIRDTAQSARYALETITRDVQSVKNFTLPSASGSNYFMVNAPDGVRTYSISDGQIMMAKGSATANPVTNKNDIKINSITFSGVDTVTALATSKQPYLTVIMKYQSPTSSAGGKQSEQLGEQTLQTTVTVDSLTN